MNATMNPPYGEKRDYPKIDIYRDGAYVGSTNWSRTLREAKDRYLACVGAPRNSVRTVRAIQYQRSSRAMKTLRMNTAAIAAPN